MRVDEEVGTWKNLLGPLFPQVFLCLGDEIYDEISRSSRGSKLLTPRRRCWAAFGLARFVARQSSCRFELSDCGLVTIRGTGDSMGQHGDHHIVLRDVDAGVSLISRETSRLVSWVLTTGALLRALRDRTIIHYHPFVHLSDLSVCFSLSLCHLCLCLFVSGCFPRHYIHLIII